MNSSAARDLSSTYAKRVDFAMELTRFALFGIFNEDVLRW